MSKGLVYTAIYGNRDEPHPILQRDHGVDYVMFTDRERAPAGWEKVLLDPKWDVASPRLRARMVKARPPVPLMDYDWFMWIDGSHTPARLLRKDIEQWLKGKSFAAYRHHHWNCTYTEIRKCKEFKKDDPQVLDLAAETLRKEGFPEDYGQVATTVLVRKNDQLAAMHSVKWLEAIHSMSIRDQVSFMYLIWKLTLGKPAEDHLHYIGPNAFTNSDFTYHGGH